MYMESQNIFKQIMQLNMISINGKEQMEPSFHWRVNFMILAPLMSQYTIASMAQMIYINKHKKQSIWKKD